MAIDTLHIIRPAGRPKIAADFSGCDDDDETIEKRERFFRLLKSLSFTDKLCIANGLGYTLRAIDYWYHGKSMPDERTRNIILKWYAKGKPVKRLLSCDSLAVY